MNFDDETGKKSDEVSENASEKVSEKSSEKSSEEPSEKSSENEAESNQSSESKKSEAKEDDFESDFLDRIANTNMMNEDKVYNHNNVLLGGTIEEMIIDNDVNFKKYSSKMFGNSLCLK